MNIHSITLFLGMYECQGILLWLREKSHGIVLLKISYPLFYFILFYTITEKFICIVIFHSKNSEY